MLTKQEITRKLRVSVDTLDRMMQANNFPKPDVYGKPHRWYIATLADWNKQLLTEYYKK